MKAISSRIILGIFILSIGVVALLSNFGILDYSVGQLFLNFWPLIIVYWGVETLFKPGGLLQRLIGVFIALIGVVLIANRIEFEPLMFNLSSLWQLVVPAILIVSGITLLTGKKKIGKSHYAVLSGLERNRGTWKLGSESYVAFLGGVELDLSLAELPSQETHLDLTAVLGGIEVKVPRDLTIICEGQSVFGGVEQLGDESAGIFTSKKETRHEPNLSTDHPNHGKILRISSSTVFGGIEIDFA
ncbi:LiaF domain-containing protein [Isachenkonia alkalipeptolytica]|uniref:DUF5668 domain-containing protein n=1 Tax=Isachenkonia alkalipeptolytica TaxID=2565777 RepID=A0AA43XNW4_9CLOT|nr:LiaF domain-containing protein [Isachenkonia alkalipeptolytica]NBG89704.1 hypothetical protein [Isachenkonia alkalipeptolytica]